MIEGDRVFIVLRAEFLNTLRMMKSIVAHFSLLWLGFVFPTQLQGSAHAEQSLKPAPDWAIEEWVVGPETSLGKLRGKVIVVDFFQLWCPGCNTFSLPLMRHWEKKFAKEKTEGKIAFVSIHTVFEGHSYQTNKRLRAYVKEKDIRHPVGVDARQKGARLPITMMRYKTRGTPEMAVIDQKGFIRFQHFGGFNPEPVEQLIRRLIEAAPESS